MAVPALPIEFRRLFRDIPAWIIPLIYVVITVAAGLVLPRVEQTVAPGYTHDVSVSAALAFFSAVSSGMMAFTGIVFAIAFVTVQFSAGAYSPRVVLMFAERKALYHILGIFIATFGYSLSALAWTDRGGSGKVPLFSFMLVVVLLVVSVLAFARLVHSINELQINDVLQVIGDRGHEVIRAMFPLSDGVGHSPETSGGSPVGLGAISQTLLYSGDPRVIARVDLSVLVAMAEAADAVVVLASGVGDLLLEGSELCRVYGGRSRLPERQLRRAVHLAKARTFEQDPKYAIRLLVDIAIRALSPAINDPSTAVQAIDQIEDLLRRLSRRKIDSGELFSATGRLRLIFPTPTWEDYLELSFDEIRQCGGNSVQVARRLRSALVGLSEASADAERRSAVLAHLERLNKGVERSGFDEQDRLVALAEDRQGLGLSRRKLMAP